MKFRLQSLQSPIFIYTIKCLLGLSVGYLLYLGFPNHQFYWTLISILLVMAPDHKDSFKLALDRMKANMIGSSVGLSMFIINGPGFLLLAIGVITTIALCSLLKLMNVGRSALATLVIVMIHEKSSNSWEIALERMGCVIVGCIIALIISLVFSYITKK